MVSIKIKPFEDIEKTLSDWHINPEQPDSLFFNPAMKEYCGKFVEVPYKYILDTISYHIVMNRINTPNWIWHHDWIDTFIFHDISESEFIFLINAF